MPGQRGVRSKAEVDGDIGVSFIDPEIFIGVEGIMQQVFQFVSEDGTPPRERDISKVNENRFSGGREGWGEVTAGVVGSVNIVNDDLNLAVVVNVREVQGHGRLGNPYRSKWSWWGRWLNPRCLRGC